MTEYMDIVNARNEVIGQANRVDVYARKLPHRVVHIFLLRKTATNKVELYLQVRSQQQTYLPGFLCSSAGGHVRVGESCSQAAGRELHEELGIQAETREIAIVEYSEEHHSRFLSVHLAISEAVPRFLDGEVEGGVFVSIDEAERIVSNGVKIHPQLAFCLPIVRNAIEHGGWRGLGLTSSSAIQERSGFPKPVSDL